MTRLIFAMIFMGNFAFGMEDNLVYLNIGGYHIVTTKETIIQSGMKYFDALFSDKFTITYDAQKNIFIDRSQKEGEFISDFLRTHKLPHHCDLKLAKRIAKYFQSDELISLIKKKQIRPKKIKSLTFSFDDFHNAGYLYCPICADNLKLKDLNKFKNLALIADHLVNSHKFRIIYSNISLHETDINLKYIVYAADKSHKFKTITINYKEQRVIKDESLRCPLCEYKEKNYKYKWSFAFKNHLVESHFGMIIGEFYDEELRIVFTYRMNSES